MSPVPKEDRDKPSDDNPECNNVENDDSVPDFIITLTSSESDSDSDGDLLDDDGYVPLPQYAEHIEFPPPIEISPDTGSFTLVPNNVWQLDEEEPHSSTTAPVFPFTVPDPPAAEASSLLWNQMNPVVETETDTGQEERVKAAMKGFQLPSPNIPDWAKNVPEDKWKEHLLDKLRQLTTGDPEDDNNHEMDP